MQLVKEILRDVLFISKITNVNNKKYILFSVTVFSQITAFADVALIVLFSTIFTGEIGSGFVNVLVSKLLEYKYVVPVFVLIRFYVSYFQSMIMKKLEMNVTKNIKVHLMTEVFEKRNYSVADAYFYINVLSGHVAFFYSNLVGFINSILQSIAYIFFLSSVDIKVFSILLIGILTLYYPLKFLIKQSKEYMHKIYFVTKTAGEEVQRIVENMFLIKILKKEREELINFDNVLVELNENDYQNVKYITLNGFLPNLITTFVFAIMITIPRYVGILTLDFIGVTLRLFQSLSSLSTGVSRVLNSHVHIAQLYKILKNRNSNYKNNLVCNVDEKVYAVQLENISFKYFNSEEYIFKNLNLNIQTGTHNLLIGPNGSGKSTLLGIISGVFFVDEGNVRTNSNNFGYIGATPLIFTKSLRENLLYGNKKLVNDNILISELKKFETFKEESSYDLDRIISNKSLSSGQMQKIAFIRALISDVDILILDESTANLDEKSRSLVFEVLKSKKITIINSTHDPNLFKSVDKIFNISIIEGERKIEFKSFN